jgi:hypothetical protein
MFACVIAAIIGLAGILLATREFDVLYSGNPENPYMHLARLTLTAVGGATMLIIAFIAGVGVWISDELEKK